MQSYLSSQVENMLELLETLVNIDSGSHDKNGIDKVRITLQTHFKELGFNEKVYSQSEKGDHVSFTHPEATAPNVLLLLHMDTVFANGTVKERPFMIQDGYAYGPGVIDMKGSHVTTLYALKALLQENALEALKNVVILFTSDEEIGAITSRKLIEKYAIGKSAVLVMEPARKDGSLVTFRRGGGRFNLQVTGRSAHSGIDPENGRSAILELAHKTIQLHDLSDRDAGISVNVGTTRGGTTVNTVPESAIAEVDLRISKGSQGEMLTEKIHTICASPTIEGTSIDVDGGIGRPPMERTPQTAGMFELIRKTGEEIGLTITEISTGGSSDASFTSALGIPTIDGMGPVGAGAHSSNEYLEIPTLVERSLLLAKVIQKLSKDNF